MRPTASSDARLHEGDLLRQVRRARRPTRRAADRDCPGAGTSRCSRCRPPSAASRSRAASRSTAARRGRRTARPADPRRRPALPRSRTAARRAGRRRTRFACGRLCSAQRVQRADLRRELGPHIGVARRRLGAARGSPRRTARRRPACGASAAAALRKPPHGNADLGEIAIARRRSWRHRIVALAAAVPQPRGRPRRGVDDEQREDRHRRLDAR